MTYKNNKRIIGDDMGVTPRSCLMQDLSTVNTRKYSTKYGVGGVVGATPWMIWVVLLYSAEITLTYFKKYYILVYFYTNTILLVSVIYFWRGS